MIPRISALELQQIPKPFDHPDWVFEIKYDGFRALARIENGVCRLVSRRDNVYKRFGRLRNAIPGDVKSNEVVLDGVIVVLDSEGKSLFNDLMHTRRTPTFAAFDILWLNGEDLREMPLLERKARLKKLIKSRPKRMLYVDHIVQNGKALFVEVCKRAMEGIVAKPAVSACK